MIPTSHRHNRCGTRKLKLRASIKTRGSSYIPRRWHGLILSHNGDTNNHSFNPNSYFDLKHVWWQSISQLLKFPKGTSRSNVAHTSCKFEPESNEADSAPTKESESSTRVECRHNKTLLQRKFQNQRATQDLKGVWHACSMRGNVILLDSKRSVAHTSCRFEPQPKEVEMNQSYLDFRYFCVRTGATMNLQPLEIHSAFL